MATKKKTTKAKKTTPTKKKTTKKKNLKDPSLATSGETGSSFQATAND